MGAMPTRVGGAASKTALGPELTLPASFPLLAHVWIFSMRRGYMVPYPVALPGVSPTYVLRAAVNATRTHRGLEALEARDCLGLVPANRNLVEMDQRLLTRSPNAGFSGGEQTRHELLPRAVLDPKLAILDATDSGLDIDALRIVATGRNSRRGPKRALIVVTHDQRLLHAIVPAVIHVRFEGRIVTSGDKQLAPVLAPQGSRGIAAQVNGREAMRS